MFKDEQMYFGKNLKKPILVTVITLFIIVPVLTGCDCLQSTSGIILDKKTKLPIDSVNISTVDIAKNTVTGRVEYSAKNGQFHIIKVLGGKWHCPNFTLYFSKRGYSPTSSTFESGSTNDTIYLNKINTTIP